MLLFLRAFPPSIYSLIAHDSVDKAITGFRDGNRSNTTLYRILQNRPGYLRAGIIAYKKYSRGIPISQNTYELIRAIYLEIPL